MPIVQQPGIVTLLTDFGTDDAYVAAMKGAVLSVNPDLRIVDVSHTVAPHDVVEAAWLLRGAFRYFPAGTVHCVVVDPGVGTARRAIAVRSAGYSFVAPDNGVLFWALRGAAHEAVALARAEYFRPEVSRTFHGRDIFAPVAAHLASGVPLSDLGEPIGDPVRLPVPEPRISGHQIHLEVVHIDRFGNLITNLERQQFEAWLGDTDPASVRITVARRAIAGVVETYGEVPPGALLAVFESTGSLEIAVREGHAARTLSVSRGTAVTLTC